jgi:hypothetical protein
MEGTNPWGDIPDEEEAKGAVVDGGTGAAPQAVSISEGFGFAPMNSGTLLTGATELPPGQLIYLQPPSSAAKVIGILVIIYGLFGLLTGIYDTATSFGGNLTLLVFVASGTMISAATIVGGVMLTNYQKRGVYLLIGTIVLSSLLAGAQITMLDEVYDDMLEEDEITQEEYDLLMSNNGLVQGIGGVLVLVCGGICSLIVAIPLMVSNNGME